MKVLTLTLHLILNLIKPNILQVMGEDIERVSSQKEEDEDEKFIAKYGIEAYMAMMS